MTNLHHALNWASRGYHVFPCEDPGPNGKKPRITKWQERASRDDLQLEAWWEEWPEANIGVALQEYEYVLDADGPEQVRWVQGNLPRTLSVKTGRVGGGAHFYFDVPIAMRLRNRTVVADIVGLEGKTQGKLVVAPGSVHTSGSTYELWDNTDPELLPPWIIERIGMWDGSLKTGGRQPDAVELVRWDAAHEYASPVTRRRGEVVYARAVRRLRRDLPVTEGWATVFYAHAVVCGEWVARGAYTYEELCKALVSLFESLDDGRGGAKGASHVIRSIHRGVAAGARSVV